MELLRMRGRPVTNCLQLYREFDLREAILRRRSFAAFAAGHLRMDEMASYHIAVWRYVLAQEEAGNAIPPDVEYWAVPGCRANAVADYWKEPDALWMLEQAEHVEAACAGVLKEVRGRLKLLICAGLFLSRHTWESCGVTVERLAAALGGAEEEARRELVLAGEHRLLLAPKCVYQARLDDRYPLKPGDRIETYELCADPLVGADSWTAVLRLEGGERLELAKGETLCVNAVNGVLVSILPAAVSNGEVTLERTGDRSFRWNGRPVVLPQGVTSFAPEPHGSYCGFLAVAGGRLDTTAYAQRVSYGGLLDQVHDPVEVRMEDDDFLVLCADGSVISSNRRWNRKRCVSLRELAEREN